MSKKCNWGKVLTGTVLGFATGLLLAPKSGMETRKCLRKKFTKCIEDMKNSKKETANKKLNKKIKKIDKELSNLNIEKEIKKTKDKKNPKGKANKSNKKTDEKAM